MDALIDVNIFSLNKSVTLIIIILKLPIITHILIFYAIFFLFLLIVKYLIISLILLIFYLIFLDFSLILFSAKHFLNFYN